jgi:hypothetical protein
MLNQLDILLSLIRFVDNVNLLTYKQSIAVNYTNL